MKISNPFGLKGSLDVSGGYKVGALSGSLPLGSSGTAELKLPVARKLAGKAFDIQIILKVDYELAKIGGLDVFDTAMAYFGEGEFAFVAKWRAMLGDDGLELSALGTAPAGSPKSKGDIVVAVGGAILKQSFAKERAPFVNVEMILLAGLESQGVGVGLGPVSTTVGGGQASRQDLSPRGDDQFRRGACARRQGRQAASRQGAEAQDRSL